MSEKAPADVPRLPFAKVLAYASGNFVVGALPATVSAFLLYFWIQTDESKTVAFMLFGAYTAVQMFGRVQDAVADPIVGYLSDRYNTRFGRRIPWVVAGAPVLLGAFVAIWFPPAAEASSTVNVIYLAVVLGAFWWGFTLVVAPYTSLLPEICPDLGQRIRVSQWMAYFEVAGTLLGMVAAGFIIHSVNAAHFVTLPEAIRPALGQFHARGYQVMAWSVAALGAVSLLPVVLFIRETGATAAKAVPFRFFEAAKVCLKSVAFMRYVVATSFFRLGFGMVVASVVFFARTVLHQTEGLAATLSGITLVVSLLCFFPVDVLSQRHGKKRVFQWGMLGFAILLPLLATIEHAPFLGRLLGPGIGDLLGAVGAEVDRIRVTHAFFIFLLIAAPVATMYVLPRAIIADVMDLDAKLTGYRREGMYNGMEAVFIKTAVGMSVVVLNLLAGLDGGATVGGKSGITLGTNALSAVGPVGGLLVLVGWLIMRGYPIER